MSAVRAPHTSQFDEIVDGRTSNSMKWARAVNGATAKVRVLRADALYLAWMDCPGLGLEGEALERFMLTDARLWFDEGQKFGTERRLHARHLAARAPQSTRPSSG
jgi:bifunctional pyridoxal-dependent enzyme with beta-cystathionase and maltose regulon repressor activities